VPSGPIRSYVHGRPARGDGTVSVYARWSGTANVLVREGSCVLVIILYAILIDERGRTNLRVEIRGIRKPYH
jgi:hypothetical protein